jgi:hypothetical protein
MKASTWRSAALATIAIALLSGCAEEGDDIMTPEGELLGGELFARYVSLGNSITAGFQSLGINDSTQRQAYPYVIAQHANATFNLPLLPRPGCPPPLSAPFSTMTIAGTPLGQAFCLFRASPSPRILQNLAVPGANILDAVDHLANKDAGDTFNRLQTFILGGRSMIDAMIAADPTLISVMLGSGDALGAALDGDASKLTSVSSFESSLNDLVAAIGATNAQDVIVIGAVNANVMPALQPGLFYWAVKQNPATAPLLPKNVNDNCAPVTGTGQPNPLTRNIISYTILFSAAPEISCADDAPFVLPPAEQAAISTRVGEYNGLLAAAATQNDWIYIDPNDLLLPALANPNLIRKCQGLATAQTAQAIFTAIQTTCPSPLPMVGFGLYISFDGIHPSAWAHNVLAQTIIAAVNDKHGLQIPIPLDLPNP